MVELQYLFGDGFVVWCDVTTVGKMCFRIVHFPKSNVKAMLELLVQNSFLCVGHSHHVALTLYAWIEARRNRHRSGSVISQKVATESNL